MLTLSHGYFLSEDPKEQAIMKPYPPLGLLYVSAYLKQHDMDVQVYDSTFGTPAGFEAHLRETKPAVVGLYANLMTRPQVVKMAAAAKRLGVWVVVGGPDPANYIDEYLAHGVDVVVIGEGEQTMLDLVPRLARSGTNELHEVDGVAFSDGNATVRTPARKQLRDLDALPFPDREAIDVQRYVDTWRTHHGRGAVSLITARGCPYTCTWCSHAVYGYSHRRRSPENVVDEVEWLVDRYRPDMLWYADDVFTMKPSWLTKYADALERRGLHLPFETISREDRLNESVVETLARMGCFRLWIGSESGSQRILDAMKRRTDADRVRDMVRLLQQHEIEAGLFIMLGYDGEEERDLVETVRLLTDAPPDIFLTTVSYPIKGTAYYEQVKDRLIVQKSWAEGSDRDFSVEGRRSDAYYRHAARWMTNEVAHARERLRSNAQAGTLLKTFVKAKAGRLGMMVNQASRVQESFVPASRSLIASAPLPS
ncbi:MAG: radical SAM protein [Bacteroidota bacterium]